MQLSFLLYLYPKDLQKLDDLGVLIEKLLIAQNQTISKLNQLIQILQKMINGTDAGNILNIIVCLREKAFLDHFHFIKLISSTCFADIVGTSVEFTEGKTETHLQTRGKYNSLSIIEPI